MAVTSDGTVWTWGDTASGPTRIEGLDHIVSVKGSEISWVSQLALKADGTAWQWSEDNPLPVQVPDPGDATGFLTQVKQIAGGAGTCRALKSDGTVWGCGENTTGQIGDGTTTSSKSWVRVVGLPGSPGSRPAPTHGSQSR